MNRYPSWLNWIESELAALRNFALNGTDHRSHGEQNDAIAAYIRCTTITPNLELACTMASRAAETAPWRQGSLSRTWHTDHPGHRAPPRPRHSGGPAVPALGDRPEPKKLSKIAKSRASHQLRKLDCHRN